MAVTSTEFYTVQDFEIFGAGARRRFEVSNTPLPLRLVRHPWSFLPGVEEETLRWLNPAETVTEPMPLVEPLLFKKFGQVFSRGPRVLNDLQNKILKDYLEEVPWQEGLLDDHFRYFALFLKRRFPQQESWSELFQAEWIRWSRLYEDHAWPSTFNSEHYELAPSFQIYPVGEKTASILEKEPGLYACVYDQNIHQLIELRLSPVQARFVDWIENDAGFSKNKLREMMEQEGFSAQSIRQAESELTLASVIR